MSTNVRTVNATAADAPSNVLREFAYVLFAQWKPAVGTAAAIFAAAVLISFLWPKYYDVTASVLVRAKQTEDVPEALTKAVERRTIPVSREDMNSELEVLCAPPVLEAALLRAANDPLTREIYHGWTGSYLRRLLLIELVPASNVIRMQMSSREPLATAALLNMILDSYLDYRAQVFDPQGTEEFYARQIDVYLKALDDLDVQMRQLVGKLGAPLPEREIEHGLVRKQELVSSMGELRTERMEKQAELARVEATINAKHPSMPPYVKNAQLDDLRLPLIEAFAEQDRVASVFQADSERAKAAADRVSLLWARLCSAIAGYTSALRGEIDAIDRNIERMEAEIERIGEANLALQQQSSDMRRITREVAVLEPSYEVLLRKREEARMMGAIRESEMRAYVSSLGRAYVPGEAAFPKKRWMLLGGLLVAIAAGLSVAMLLEFLAHTIKRPIDVTRILQVPVLLSLPCIREPTGAAPARRGPRASQSHGEPPRPKA